MPKSEEKSIDYLLAQGKTKRQVFDLLSEEFSQDSLLFHLNNVPMPRQRRKFRFFNFSLMVLLSYITLKKLIIAYLFKDYAIIMLSSLVVPIINLYLLREIWKFHKIGYQFLAPLSLLALVYSENRVMPDLAIYLLISALSAFLYFKLFPKQEQVKLP